MATRVFELHVDAERELDDTIAAIEGARDGWGLQFLAAFDVAIATIIDYPERQAVGEIPHLRDGRLAVLDRLLDRRKRAVLRGGGFPPQAQVGHWRKRRR